MALHESGQAGPQGQPGQPGPGQPGPGQAGPGQGGDLASKMTILAGTGFKDFFDIVIKAQAAGIDISQFMSQPGLPKLLMGVGLKNAANSENLLKPLMESFDPPPQQDQIDPQQIQAAMQMLSARLGPGLQGVQPPAGGPPALGGSPGLGAPGGGAGIQPPGIV